MERRRPWVLGTLAVAVLLCALACPFAGPVELSPAILWRAESSSIEWHLYLTTRLPRVLFALVCGGGLALAGAIYQAVLRNDLAEPYSLGVASGSALGALAVWRLGAGDWQAAGAFLGAVGALGLLHLLTRLRRGPTTPAVLLLAGVTLNFLFGALILLIQYLSDPFQTLRLLRWLMGGLEAPTFRVVAASAAALAGVTVLGILLARELNLLSLGDEGAFHLGVPVERVRLVALGGASVLVALLVAFAGPIGFVGLIVPHVLRRFVGADHRWLLPASVGGGAVFLTLADTAARNAFSQIELPVGILTAALGAPFFLIILIRRRNV